MTLRRIILSLTALFVAQIILAATPMRVACIGNSITYGDALADRTTQSYPAQLQQLLDSVAPGGYTVGNFGRNGATLLRRGHRPYNEQLEYRQALDFKPDIVIIHLGINDTDPRDWPHYGAAFVSDYVALIDSLRAVNPAMRVIVANLSPIHPNHPRWDAGTHVWRLRIREAIERVAEAAGADLIDFERPLRDRLNLIPDNLHPSPRGARLLAEEAFGAITGRWGGLQMPMVYTDSMVIQRDRPLTIRGRADAGSHIKVTLDGRTYRTISDLRGDWKVTTAPLATGKKYTLTVTDRTDTLTFSDILAGEVWIASGQSNMAFKLQDSKGAERYLNNADDDSLRIFNMEARGLPYAYQWSDEARREASELRYYKPTRWRPSRSGEVGTVSAIGWHFARILRDSLQVPVGIICNAIGGTPAESWIDTNWLLDGEPGTLRNWPDNHHVQDWLGYRARENLVDIKTERHCFEPGFLFATGIKPLGRIPIAGVVWYQGESNAHNIEIHEVLFPMLVDCWRDYFCDPQMPFCFTQLSSHDRPSWPEFRYSQLLMSERIPHTAMAVSSDHGDSLDVHPTNKLPVAERLALGAMALKYGGTAPYLGPRARRTYTDGNRLVVVMDHAGTGLSTSDGAAPATFEIAEIDGYFRPATATIHSDTIILESMEIKNPRFVRYGWRPYTRANVVNSFGLPASTFHAEADGANNLATESGIEYGLSGTFFGRAGGDIVIAGGCNFPTDTPLAPDARKEFYQGVYAASADSPLWRRIGTLPRPLAYGASAQVDDGEIVIAGGSNADGASRQAWLMKITPAGTTFEALPDLPTAVDNASAAAIGRKVYIAGGNADGTPSRQLLMLDLDNTDAGWQSLPNMPGNPRVQPVAAASAGRLYVWGGFAPRSGKKSPTLNTDGLCYDPSTRRWHSLQAPTDADGQEISLGGGVATTLPDGRIVAAGGVNKDVFLEALRNQAPDYLMHPIDWYRFNPCVVIFTPADATWQIAATDLDDARAGAAIVPDTDRGVFIYGGELKPRIRTNTTTHITF